MFQYSSKTLFSRLPEQLKFCFMFAFTVIALIAYDIYAQTALFVLILSLLVVSPYRQFPRLLKTLLPLLVFVNLAIYLFFSKIDPNFWVRMLIISLRFSSVFMCFAFFLHTTNLFKFVEAMRRIGVPETIRLAIYVVLRFLPEMEREFADIRGIQHLKGASPKRPLAYIKALTLPLLYAAFDRADELAIAYELRKRRYSLEK